MTAEHARPPDRGPDASGHSHAAGRGEELRAVPDSRLLVAVVLNQLLTVAEAVAGVVSGSAALLSDAAHNFNDANALLIAYIARRISRRQATPRYTFGYRRAEMIGAVINLTLLAVIGVYLAYEGVSRFFRPVEIIGWLMAAASILALIIDLGTALLLWSLRRGSLNVRTAFLHNLIDALASLAVLLGAVAILWLDWTWIDPLLTLLIAAYVLWQVAKMLPQAMRVLMEGAPADVDLDDLLADIEAIEGVVSLHHLHVWELDEQHRALEAHVVITREQASELVQIKQRVKQCLVARYGIAHSTLEFEFDDEHTDQDHDTSVVARH